MISERAKKGISSVKYTLERLNKHYTLLEREHTESKQSSSARVFCNWILKCHCYKSQSIDFKI